MSIITKIKKNNAIKAFFYQETKLLSDKQYIQLRYYRMFKKFPDLKHPKTYNEKLNWLKLYDRNPFYCKLVDKYEVKKYVSNIIGKDYIIPTYAVYESIEEIDLSKLPEQFVLKGTHDGGSVVICRNKADFDFETVKNKLRKSLKTNFYWHGREWPYKKIKPRIIAEAFMEDYLTAELRDYKFFCFDG